MGQTEFRNRYTEAIHRIREAGIHVPLILDADRWGRNGDSLLENGQYLIEQDPDHNLMFSWHLWDPRNYGMGSKSSIRKIIDGSIERDICLIVGEFGPCEQCNRCGETQIEWRYLIEYCHLKKIGWMAWVWRWQDCHSMIAYDPGEYGDWNNSPWGRTIAFDSPYSIQQTSVRPGAVDPQSAVSENPPGRFVLEQNYPNPFNSFTMLEIELFSVSDISIEIFDTEGRKIRTLVRGRYDKGRYEFKWRGLDETNRNVSSGMYLARLRTENGDESVSVTKKMLYIK
jgi:hypothetical protein